MNYDTVVVGAGVAGLTAGVRLAEAGQRVAVLAKGAGGTHLTGATVDVLGYASKRVDAPAAALPGFVADHPEHPYARVSFAEISASLEWLKAHVRQYRYEGTLDQNYLLPTAVGVPKPAAAAPETMTSGDLRSGGRFVIVGFRSLKDFYPTYCADNLCRATLAAGASVSARGIEIDPPVGGEADVGPLRFARLFEDAEFRKRVISDVEGRLDSGEVVGFPAVLGLRDPQTVWHELQDGLGTRVFEIPTLPPSVPGIRLFESLKAALRQAAGRLIMGGRVAGAITESSRVEAIVQEASARPVTYRARWFVLATGGFASGGLHMDSHGSVSESIFGLPVAGVPPRGQLRFLPTYFADHPMGSAGVAVDDTLRPVDRDGRPIFENLLAAGATIAGARPWKEKSGEGISLSTGHGAASLILEAAS